MRYRFTMIALALAISGTLVLAQGARTPEALFKAARHAEEVQGDLKGAIEQYKKVVQGGNRPLAAQALLRMADCYRKLGDAESRRIYEQVVREFSDQIDAVTVARANLGERQSGPPSERQERSVWSGPKVDLFGRVSPDGRFISFSDWSGFNNLAVHELRSNTDRTLSANTGWFGEDPNWGEADWSAVSPDSSQIAYAWIRKDANEIRIVPVSAGASAKPRVLLTVTDGTPGVRDWSPDGKLLAVTLGRKGSTQIAIVNVADGSLRVLKSEGWRGADWLFFSRDSRFIAYDRPASDDDDVQQRDVFILAVDGSREIRAVSNAADDRAAGWSPDGRYLLFTSTRTGARSLWGLPVSDGNPTGAPELLKTEIGSSISLGVTNSGGLYLHKSVSDRDVVISSLDLKTGEIGQPVRFSQGLLPVPMSPQWSPDGKLLAYQVRGEEEGLAIRSVESGEVRRLRNLQYFPDPRWSPDGRSLVAGARDAKGRSGVIRVDVTTGKSTMIVETAGLGSSPRWSADGIKIYYVGRQPFMEGDRPVIEHNLATNVERQIFKHRLLNNFELSPDGKYLAFQTDIDPGPSTSSLIVVPLNGGEARQLVTLPAQSAVAARGAIAWTADSRSILTARKSGSHVELWTVEVEHGQARRLSVDATGWNLQRGIGFALSPDGRSIAYMTGTSQAEVWALENFLPSLTTNK